MTSRLQPNPMLAGLCGTLLLASLALSPGSCSWWGTDSYVVLGLVALLLAAVSPFALRGSADAAARLLRAALQVVLVAAVWVAGLLVSDLPVLCRLF